MDKQYDGTAYICTVGSDFEIGPCRDSIAGLVRRQGDAPPVYGRGTKGYEGRQQHINKFLDGPHDFIFMMDSDQTFPANSLERLRSHKLPFVSGFYMRRSHTAIAPVWFKPWSGKWPLEPWTDPLEPGRLYEIGASGWGCTLMHRDVVLAVRELLKGEGDVLEDDMDVWPYDLAVIMEAIRGLRA